MENLVLVAGQVAVLFALMGVGAILRWYRLLDDKAVKGMVNLLVIVVTPALIIDAFQRPFEMEKLRGLGVTLLIAIIFHLALIAIARCAIRHPQENTRRVLQTASVFSNAGFMGIPLQQAVLGDEGVFYGILYVVVFNLFIWSWGLATMRRGNDANRRTLFINPGTVGLALGLAVFLMPVELPAVVRTPVRHLANLNTPLAMVIIGHYLAGARLGPVARLPVAYCAGLIRLLAGPMALIAALWPLRTVLARPLMLAVVTAAAAPTAAMVSMFAARYDRDIDCAVGIVGATTLASIVTMPLVIALAMSVL